MNKYIVMYEIDGKVCEPTKETANSIFKKMDMDDVYSISIVGLWVIQGKSLIPCEFYGTWHNPSDPLLMLIVSNDDVLDIGHGTDH